MFSNNLFPWRLFALVCLVTASGLHAQAPLEAKKALLEKEPPDSSLRVELTRVQLLLDRANFRPGKIDGLGGEFTQKAADRYCLAQGLPPGSRLDTASIGNPYREYTVAEEDLKWVGRQAPTPQLQEKLKAMLYADLWELVSERFHCDLGFLRELNPGLTNCTVGTVFRVPDALPFEMTEVTALEKMRLEEEKLRKEDVKKKAEALALLKQEASSIPEATPPPLPEPTPAPLPKKRLVLLRTERLIEVYEAEKIIACFPCTPGSSRVPVTPGNWKVVANILMPHFRWDKSVLDRGVRSDTAYNLPPGPNNPVGIVWIAINRPSIGMHGTPTPDQIGRNQSSGCIRLTNWDAFLLSQMVEKGTPLEVR